MKYFLLVTSLTLLLLGSIIGYKQNFFNIASLPYDDEQNALDEQIVIHFSHVVAENTPKGLAVARFAELVEEKTAGRVIVQVYPNGILYHDDNEFDALQQNDIQMIAPTFSKVTSYMPSWEILDLPFLIETDEQLQQVLTGPLKSNLLKDLQAIQIKGLDFWSNGFKQIAANEQLIKQATDFKNLNIRVMPSNALNQQFTLLGANPIQTSFGDVFYEIENNTVQAQENTISNLYSKGFYQYEKHITLSNHGIMGYAVLMNEDFWNSLTGELQQHIVDALAEMNDWQFAISITQNNDSLKELEQLEDITISPLTLAEKMSWKSQLQPLYTKYEHLYPHNYQLLMKQLHFSN